MHFGFQKRSLIFRFKQTEIVLGMQELLCVLVSVALFFLVEFTGRESPVRQGYIERGSYGQGEETMVLIVEGLEEKGVEVSFPVGERQYTKEQAKAAMKELGVRLGTMILGENSSLSEVRKKLYLPSRDAKTGFSIRWHSENTDVIALNGNVNGEIAEKNMAEKNLAGKETAEKETVVKEAAGKDTNKDTDKDADKEATDNESGYPVKLEAEVSDGLGGYERFVFQVMVFGQERSEKELALHNMQAVIEEQEQCSRTEEGFYLPQEYQGRALNYREKGSRDHVWLLVLGPLLAVLLKARGKSEEQKQKKERERKLLLDYSEVISKMQIFLGAGMTVRTAWERIAFDYQEALEKGGLERPAYEEMLQTCYQLKSGAPEGRAYEEFGRRCVLQPYLKLAGLLEQNRKTGTKNLRQLLQLEMTDAFEQRKNLARRQGEEAATKLLIPLFLMLGVVMVIVVVPAFLTFY